MVSIVAVSYTHLPVIVFSDFELNWELEETEKYTFLYEMTKQYHYTQVGDNPYFEIYIRQ